MADAFMPISCLPVTDPESRGSTSLPPSTCSTRGMPQEHLIAIKKVKRLISSCVCHVDSGRS